jgi:hypothetical protein
MSCLVQNDVGGCFPDKGAGLAIPVGESLIDRRFQFVRAAESAEADHPSSNEGKKSFDLIQP